MGKAQKALKKFKEQQKYNAGQIEYDRMVSKDTLDLDIKGISREIAYKKNELESNDITEKMESFIDGKKPRFLIEHEIDRLEMQKKHKQFMLKKMEEDNAKIT